MPVKLSIVIPAHNEEPRISRCLEKVAEFLKGKRDVEVVISEDGSADRTLEIARSFAKRDGRIRILHSERRLGKGGGLIRGLKAARGENVVFMDADCAVEPLEIPKLLDGLEKADLATGSRTIRDSIIVKQSPLLRQIAGTSFNLLVNLLFGLHSSDTQCGFKAMRKPALQAILPSLKRTGFETDVEMLVAAKRLGLKVVEVPIRWRHVEGSKVNVFKESAKMFSGVLRLWLGQRK